MDNFRRIEGVVRGFANHRRVQVLHLLEKDPELSVEEIAETLKVNFKTISAHVRRLAVAGLVMKRSEGRNVRHKLTPRGNSVLAFLHALQ